MLVRMDGFESVLMSLFYFAGPYKLYVLSRSTYVRPMLEICLQGSWQCLVSPILAMRTRSFICWKYSLPSDVRRTSVVKRRTRIHSQPQYVISRAYKQISISNICHTVSLGFRIRSPFSIPRFGVLTRLYVTLCVLSLHSPYLDNNDRRDQT